MTQILQKSKIPHYGKSKPYVGKEDDFQKSCERYLRVSNWKDKNYFHPPNGGNRNAKEGAKFKSMGVKAGVSDLIFLEPNQRYAGLVIELKVRSVDRLVPKKGIVNRVPGRMGTVRPNQKEFLTKCLGSGYFVAVVWNLDEFIGLVSDYFTDKL